jgi:general secretion pathway protein K
MPIDKNDSGVALLMVLIFVMLLAIIVVEFSFETQVDASFVENRSSDAQVYLAAKSAIANGISLLAEDLLDSAENGEPEVDSELDPIPWGYGQPFEPLGDANLRTVIADEFGKINLNALLIPGGEEAKEERVFLVETVRALFIIRNPESNPDELVDSLLDWLDYGVDDGERSGGAEDDYYTGLENPFACKNGPMDNVEELLLIKGFTPEIYYGNKEEEQRPLFDYFTVHGDWGGRINVNTAQELTIEAVLTGLGNSGQAQVGSNPQDSAIAIYEQAHANAPFTNPTDLNGYVQIETPRVPNDPNNPNNQNNQNNPNNAANRRNQQISQIFTTRSNVFRIYGDGLMGGTMLRIEAYVWRRPLSADATDERAAQAMEAKEPFRILDWRIVR